MSKKIYYYVLEDGTDRGFRNVGKPQSDAGEIPKRIHTLLLRICKGDTTGHISVNCCTTQSCPCPRHEGL